MSIPNLAAQVEIYTDGGCDPNPGPGGWGAILVFGADTKEINGADPATTNNRMELTAAISALRVLKRRCTVNLHTDSQYLRRGVVEWLPGWLANDWRRANGSPVQNRDLWEELAGHIQRQNVEWYWVRGHRGCPLNERADQLATAARRALVVKSRGSARPVARRAKPEQESNGLPEVTLYARGCALGTPGPGGYAAVLLCGTDKPKLVSGAWPLTTNNVMELWAVVAGLQALSERSRVLVNTPSKYVVDGATRWLPGWERRDWRVKDGRPVKHREIWQELSHVMGDHDVRWMFLPASTDDPHSQRAAQAAREEADKL